MKNPNLFPQLLTFVFYCCLSGCKTEWQLSLENQSDAECSVYVSMGYAESGKEGQSSGSSTSSLENIAKGHNATLVVGNEARTITEIKLVQGEQETILTPNLDILPGKHYHILVNPEGKIEVNPSK